MQTRTRQTRLSIEMTTEVCGMAIVPELELNLVGLPTRATLNRQDNTVVQAKPGAGCAACNGVSLDLYLFRFTKLLV